MRRERGTQPICVLKLVLAGLVFLATANTASAATIDWKGATSTDWGTATNWSSGSLPGSSDAVRIGVVSFTNQPILKSGATTTIASLTFGTIGTITLTINSGFTLAVTGAITQSASSGNIGTLTITLAGAGTITGASLTIGDNSTAAAFGATNTLKFVVTITSLHISGNATVNSTSNSVLIFGLGLNDATFSLEGGTTTIDGTILTVNTQLGIIPLVSAVATFSVDIPSGSALSPILQLTNAVPINTASVAASIDFYNNTGGTGTSTVNYSGTTQEVYANGAASLDNSPQTYQYLQLTGSGTKTVDAGTLTVAKDLTSSTTSVLFNTNNTIATIGGSWTNSSSVTQGSGNITVTGSVTNNSGGTLNLGTGNLLIATNYTNNVGGVYTQSTGTTYFNGSGAQALVDNSTTGTTFKLVGFSGGGTATMSAGTNNVNFKVAATGVLTMSNSSKLAAGSPSAAYLTLKSDTTGAATVAAIPATSSITGLVTVQRFVQGNATYNAVTGRWKGRNYRFMSSQVNEGADASSNTPYSLNYLGAGTIITDCTSTYSTTGGNPSLYFYNEHYTPSNSSFTSGNFIGVTNITNTTATGTITTTDATNGAAKIYAGGGFMMYFRGDKVTHISGSPSKTSYPYVAPESVTFSATGNLNQGSYSVVSWTGTAGLLYTTTNAGNSTVRGYNLVGNPYASSIDWSTFSNSSSAASIYGFNVDPTVYIFNPLTSNYDTYNAATNISTGSASKTIPSGQGFIVHANNPSPTLTFKETAKSNIQLTGSNLLLGIPAGTAVAAQQLLRLRLVIDTINYDEMVIGFNSSAKLKYDYNEDSAYFPGLNAPEGLSSYSSDSVRLSVNFSPLPKQTADVIRLDVEASNSGQLTLQRTQLDVLPKIYQVWLMDTYKKDSLDLRNNSTYIFDIDKTDSTSFGGNRFRVVIRQDPALGIHLLNFTATKAKGGSQLVWATENEENYTNFTAERSNDGGVNFRVLGGYTSDAGGTYSFLDKNALPGQNMYRVKIEDLNGSVTYTNVITLIYGNSGLVAQSNINVYPNPSNGLIKLTINPANNAIPGLSSLQNYLTIPQLNSSNGSAAPSYGIKIINVTGAVVQKANSSAATWEDNVSTLTPGTYLIQVVNNKDKSLVGSGTFIKM